MKLRSILAGGVALTLLASPVLAQTGQGSSPVSIVKGGTGAATASAARDNLGVTIGTNVEAWDADLDCLAANSTAGLLARTGAGTCAARTLTAPAAGFTITNPAGTAGNPTFVLANDLAALEALASTGFAVRTATDTWAQRTITGTANAVCVTNGDGVSGNPTLDICSGFLSTAHSWAGVQTLAAPIFTGVADNQGTLKFSSFVTSTQITANQNDYTATDSTNTCTTKLDLRLSSNASRNVSGLSCSQAEGDIRVIHNVGANNIVLTNQDTNSTAGNRFLFGGDVTLAPDTSICIRYDGVSSRWRAITTPGAGGGSFTAATQSDQETATSTTVGVTPGRQQFHPGHPKAWALVTQSAGSYTLAATFGVASLNKTGTGVVQVNLTTAFSSSSYAAIVSPTGSSTILDANVAINGASQATVSIIRSSTEAATDGGFSIVFFGDQ